MNGYFTYSLVFPNSLVAEPNPQPQPLSLIISLPELLLRSHLSNTISETLFMRRKADGPSRWIEDTFPPCLESPGTFSRKFFVIKVDLSVSLAT